MTNCNSVTTKADRHTDRVAEKLLGIQYAIKRGVYDYFLRWVAWGLEEKLRSDFKSLKYLKYSSTISKSIDFRIILLPKTWIKTSKATGTEKA